MANKLFIKNLIANSLNQALGIGFPVLIQYYLIRHLKLEDIGYWNIINSTQALVLIFIGFSNICLIKILSETSDLEEQSKYITNSFVLLYLLLAIPLFFFLIYLIYSYPSLQHYILISSIPIITTPLSVEYYFQATLKNDFIFYRRLITRIVFIILLFLIVKKEADFIKYACIVSLTISLEHVINFYFVKKYICLKNISLGTIKYIFINSVKYIPFNYTYNVLPHYSIIIGAYFFNVQTIAVFSILFRLVNLATTFVTSSVMVIFPYRIKSIKEQLSGNTTEKYLRNTMIVSMGIIVILIIFRNTVFKMFLNLQTVPYLDLEFSILCFYIPVHSIYNYITFNHYFVKNKIFFVSALNLSVILIYFLVILSGRYIGYNIPFSILVIIPAAFSTLILYFAYHYTTKNERWRGR